MSKSKSPPFFKDTTILDLRECYLNALTYYDRLVVADNFEKITECEAGVSNDTFYFVNTCALACEISMKLLSENKNYLKIHSLDRLYEGCSSRNKDRLECQYEKSTQEAAVMLSVEEIKRHPATLKSTATLFKDAFLNSRYHTENNKFFKGLIERGDNFLSLMVLTHACVTVAMTEHFRNIISDEVQEKSTTKDDRINDAIKRLRKEFPLLPGPFESLPHAEECHDYRLDIVNSHIDVPMVSLLDIYRNSLCFDTSRYFENKNNN